MLKSKQVKDTLKAKGYNQEEVETGKAMVGQDSMRLLQKMADNNSVDSTKNNNEPEFTKMRRTGMGSGDKNSSRAGYRESKEVVRTLVENIPEETLRQIKLRRKKVSFKEEAEEVGLDQESGEWLLSEKASDAKISPGIQKNGTRTPWKVKRIKTVVHDTIRR